MPPLILTITLTCPALRLAIARKLPEYSKGSKLGAVLYNIYPQAVGSLAQGRFTITIAEARKFLTQQPGWRLTLIKILLIYILDIPAD